MATPNVSSPASYPQSTTEVSQRVALYGRVSTKDKGQEVQNQLRQLREFAAHSGWTIVAEYIDHESGKGSDREQFQAMFDAASKRQFDVLLFWSLDRLSREGVLPTLQHLQRLTSYVAGKEMEFAAPSIQVTPGASIKGDLADPLKTLASLFPDNALRRGINFAADVTLSMGEVVHDYSAPAIEAPVRRRR